MREGKQCGGRESRQVIPKIVLAGVVASGHGTGRDEGSRGGGSDPIRL